MNLMSIWKAVGKTKTHPVYQDRVHFHITDSLYAPARLAQHEREQPDNPRHVRLVGEHYLEVGEVDLPLMTWRRLETDFK